MKYLKTLAILSVFLVITAAFGVAGAQEAGKPKDKDLTHLYYVTFHEMEKLRIGMEAVIKYVQETGNDTTKLTELKNSFVAKQGEIKTIAEGGDKSAFKDAIAQLRNITKEFKTVSHGLLGNKTGEAQTRVAKAIQDNKDYLQSLVENIKKAREEVETEEFDEAVADAENKTEKFKEGGANVSAIKAKLAEIEAKRETLKLKLKAALESCNATGIGICNTTEAQEYRAFREEIKNQFGELREIARKNGMKHKVANAIDRWEKLLTKTSDKLEKVKERGIDITVDTAKLDEVKKMIDAAKEKYDAEDYEGANEELSAAKDAFKSLISETREEISEKREEAKSINSTKEREETEEREEAKSINATKEREETREREENKTGKGRGA